MEHGSPFFMFFSGMVLKEILLDSIIKRGDSCIWQLNSSLAKALYIGDVHVSGEWELLARKVKHPPFRGEQCFKICDW